MITPLTFNAAYFHLRASNVLEFESNSLESQLKFTLCFSTFFYQLKPAKFSRVNFFNLTFVKQTNKQTNKQENTKVRAMAFQLFGVLPNFLSTNTSRKFANQVDSCFVQLLLHLFDSKPLVGAVSCSGFSSRLSLLPEIQRCFYFVTYKVKAFSADHTG